MKKAICIVAVILFTAGTSWGESAKTCKKAGELAAQIMKARQLNTPMSKVVDIFDGNEYWTKVIIMAYEKPRYSSEKYQKNAINDFRNRVYMGCLKSRN